MYARKTWIIATFTGSTMTIARFEGPDPWSHCRITSASRRIPARLMSPTTSRPSISRLNSSEYAGSFSISER
jgi:hypothetical protein